MRKLILASLVLGLILSATSVDARKPQRQSANPSAIIAAELAFAKLAQAKGQWTAFRTTSTPDAEMFVPQRVRAKDWLKGRADPAVSDKWQPHQVWSSCDGTFGVTRGAWQRPDGVGYFTTVWQRQKKGGYKWILNQGDALSTPMPAPEMISAKIAECRGIATAAVTMIMPNPTRNESYGNSVDDSLKWYSGVEPSRKREFVVKIWIGSKYEIVIDATVAAR